VLEEIADVLEKRGEPYAAIDLDWLAWFDAGWDDDDREFDLMLRNLKAVVANYRTAGLRHYLLALSVETDREVAGIREVLKMPIRVVRLTTDLETITSRLSPTVTAAREADLHWAAVWLAEGRGVGLEDVTIANDRPIREVALEVMAQLGWN
jgi:hypothetical protein